MKVYDENGTLLINPPDLSKGYLTNSKRFVQHHPLQKEKRHFEIMDGTTDLRHIVVDVPEIPAWDEYEDIQIYHIYTPEELYEINKPTDNERLKAVESAVLELMLKYGGVTNV